MPGEGFFSRRIQHDERARVSFAVMGVIILVVGGFSTVYLASINKESVINDIEESHLSRMRNAAALTHEREP